MKKLLKRIIRTFSLFTLVSFVFVNCTENTEISNEDVLNLNEAGSIKEFKSIDDYFVTLKSSSLDNNLSDDGFYSLKDLFNELENLQEDSLKVNEFLDLVDKYKEVVSINNAGDLKLIVNDPKLANELNCSGLVKVGDEYYKFEASKIKVYTKQGNNYILSRIENRFSEDVLKSTTADNVVSKTGNWNYEYGPYNISDHRRVTIYKFVEFNSKFGVYVGGRIYYKKKNWRGKWVRCNADLKMEYSASSFQYIDINGISAYKTSLFDSQDGPNTHELEAGITYTNASSSNHSWSLVNPVIKFWRDDEGEGTCYVFEQIN